MVRFREHLRNLANFQLFALKAQIFRENPVLERNSQLLWSKTHFVGSGPPKKLPGAYVYKGFWAGLPKDRFWAKKSLLGTRNTKNSGISHILVQWAGYLENGEDTLKNNQETIGLRKVLGRCRIVIFQQFPNFDIKSEFSSKTQNVLRGFCNFPRFSSRAARCARAFKTNAIPSLLGVSGALGPFFRKMWSFIENAKMRILLFSRRF